VLLLALDTATPAISAALAEVGSGPSSGPRARLIVQRVVVDGRAHAERLAPEIDAILNEGGIKPKDLAAIVAGVGPGPFTGLRVGLMTAATLGSALGIPTYGVCTLDALGAATTGRVLVATDARRREVYWAIYADGRRVTDPGVDKPAELASLLSRERVLQGVGEGTLRYAGVLGIAAAEPLYPPLEHLVALAAERVHRKEKSETLTPLYLRRPDAVERVVP
jgi:tRNA threonylcarbamoyl adenosine modification protein YeaZ